MQTVEYTPNATMPPPFSWGTTTDNLIVFSPVRRYTLEEFYKLPEPPDRAHYELIQGVLFIVPPPDPPHGKIDARLKVSLIRFTLQNDIAGSVYHPREAIYLSEASATYFEPDMMFVGSELEARMGDKRTSADIVFEYLSTSTANYDRNAKAETYLSLGVQELWLIDHKTWTIEVRRATMRDNRLVWDSQVYRRGETAESVLLNGWRVPVNEIFTGL